MSLIFINPYAFGVALDADAAAYIAAVETADSNTLEDGVKTAINDFVVGCKADGIWSAIKASCILAGARTLSGALVPLVGTAPANSNFVSGDYNRKTGLVGDASTKSLNSNRNNNADPQNSKHLAVYASTVGTNTSTFNSYIGVLQSDTVSGRAEIDLTSSGTVNNMFAHSATGATRTPGVGLLGVSRANSSDLTARASGSSTTVASTSSTPTNMNIFVFARHFNNSSVNQRINARLAFYSIGESIDLALLDTRVTALINAYAAAIP
jgi:hypothetical protein